MEPLRPLLPSRTAAVLIQKVVIATIKPATTTATKLQKPSVRLGFGVRAASFLLSSCAFKAWIDGQSGDRKYWAQHCFKT